MTLQHLDSVLIIPEELSQPSTKGPVSVRHR